MKHSHHLDECNLASRLFLVHGMLASAVHDMLASEAHGMLASEQEMELEHGRRICEDQIYLQDFHHEPVLGIR